MTSGGGGEARMTLQSQAEAKPLRDCRGAAGHDGGGIGGVGVVGGVADPVHAGVDLDQGAVLEPEGDLMARNTSIEEGGTGDHAVLASSQPPDDPVHRGP